MGRQGKQTSEEEVLHICKLLKQTDLPISEIAKIKHVSRAHVVEINRKAHVREYAGRRNTWTVEGVEHVG